MKIGLLGMKIIKDSKFIILLSYNSAIQVWDLEKKEKILDHKISQERYCKMSRYTV